MELDRVHVDMKQSIRKGNRSELRAISFLSYFCILLMNNYLILYKHKIFLVLNTEIIGSLK